MRGRELRHISEIPPLNQGRATRACIVACIPPASFWRTCDLRGDIGRKSWARADPMAEPAELHVGWWQFALPGPGSRVTRIQDVSSSVAVEEQQGELARTLQLFLNDHARVDPALELGCLRLTRRVAPSLANVGAGLREVSSWGRASPRACLQARLAARGYSSLRCHPPPSP